MTTGRINQIAIHVSLSCTANAQSRKPQSRDPSHATSSRAHRRVFTFLGSGRQRSEECRTAYACTKPRDLENLLSFRYWSARADTSLDRRSIAFAYGKHNCCTERQLKTDFHNLWHIFLAIEGFCLAPFSVVSQLCPLHAQSEPTGNEPALPCRKP